MAKSAPQQQHFFPFAFLLGNLIWTILQFTNHFLSCVVSTVETCIVQLFFISNIFIWLLLTVSISLLKLPSDLACYLIFLFIALNTLIGIISYSLSDHFSICFKADFGCKDHLDSSGCIFVYFRCAFFVMFLLPCLWYLVRIWAGFEVCCCSGYLRWNVLLFWAS